MAIERYLRLETKPTFSLITPEKAGNFNSAGELNRLGHQGLVRFLDPANEFDLLDEAKGIAYFLGKEIEKGKKYSYAELEKNFSHYYGCVKLTLLPPEKVCLLNLRTKGGRLFTSYLGETANAVREELARQGIKSGVIVGRGLAGEITDKPFAKTRTCISGELSTEEIRRVQDKSACLPFDGDLFLTVENPEITLEMVKSLIQKSPRLSPVIAEKIIEKDSWREGFKRLNIGNLGHMTFLSKAGIYAAENRLVEQFMSEWVAPMVSIFDIQGEIYGVRLNFAPEHNEYSPVNFEQKNRNERRNLRFLQPTIIHWPEYAYPQERIYHALYGALHTMRDLVAYNRFLLLDYASQPIIWENSLLDSNHHREIIRWHVFQSANWVARNVFYQFAKEAPQLVAENPVIAEKITNLCWETFASTLNADPYRGSYLILSPNDRLDIAFTCGLGLVDTRGLYQSLAYFLHERNRLAKLRARMETCDWGPIGLGFPTFLEFLMEETQGDISTVINLLTPDCFQGKINQEDLKQKIVTELNKFPAERLNQINRLRSSHTLRRVWELSRKQVAVLTKQARDNSSGKEITELEVILG